MYTFLYKMFCRLLLLLLITSTSYGQFTKRNVRVVDYDKWSTLSSQVLSPDGKWVSYKYNYDVGQDTVFVKNIRTGITQSIAGGSGATFSSCGSWAVLSHPEKGLLLYHLKSGTMQWIQDVIGYSFSGKGGKVAVHRKLRGQKVLQIYSQVKNPFQIDDVEEFNYSNEGNLALICQGEVKILDLEEKAHSLGMEQGVYKKIQWSGDSQTLVFFEEKNGVDGKEINQIIHAYHFKMAQIKSLDLISRHNMQDRIVSYSTSPLVISEDGNKVFFYVDSISRVKNGKEIVQVWDAASPLEYPAMQNYKELQEAPKLSYWDTVADSVVVLATAEEPLVKMTPDYSHMISYSKIAYGHSYESNPPTDYYITSLASRKKTLLLKNFTTEPFRIMPSPKGKYIAYFRDGDYWVYDVALQEHFNLTKSGAFNNLDFDDAGASFGYTVSGWTLDEKAFFVYDAFDIWILTMEEKKNKRITHGSEQGIRFRICDALYRRNGSMSVIDFPMRKFDLGGGGLLLQATGKDYQSGYYLYTKEGFLKKMVYGKNRVSGIVKAEDTERYLFIDETFTNPPRLFITNTKGNKPVEMLQTNKHYQKYNWGTSEVIHYKNSKDEILKGALYYPANYNPGKKYPMVVKIYESLSDRFNKYSNPSEYDRTGFTLTNYVLDGYFVLMPDIKYEIGNPFVSANDCVISAVKAVVQKGMVDAKRIGIIGHSYGGSEVSFIITQSSLFAAAVAGAPVNDFLNAYLTLNFEYGRSLGWKFESQQFRMGFSPFSDMDAYLRNSALTHVSKIETPLLSWTGSEDKTVYWEQSLSLHLALRRLQKNSLLLVYPGEGHIIWDKEARADLSKRIKNWFDLYLKDK